MFYYNTQLQEVKGFDKVVYFGKSSFGYTSLRILKLNPLAEYSTNVFEHSSQLSQVDLNGVTFLPSYTFSYCEKLKVVFGLENVLKIDQRAFERCALETATLNGNAIFGDYVFFLNKNLKRVDLNGVTKISNAMFESCYSLEEIVGLQNVIEFGSNAFRDDNLKSVTLNQNAVYGLDVFTSNKNLEEVDFNFISIVPDNLLKNCENVRVYKNTENITKIGRYAFSGVPLEEISMSQNVEYGDGAFAYCKNLKKVVLNGVKSLPNNIFRDCKNLAEISGIEEVEQFGDYSISGLPFKNYTMNSSVVYGQSLFANCEKLLTVDLNGINVIPYGFFFNAVNLYEINGLENVIQFGDLSLKNTAITFFEYYDNVTYGFGVVSECRFLEEVILGPYLKLDIYEFADCVSLKKIVGLENVTLFKTHALSNTGLTEITLNPNAKYFGGETFMDSPQLKKVNLNNKLIIEKQLFKNCENLVEVVGMEKVTNFKEEAFSNTSLQRIILKENVVLEKGAFSNNKNLEFVDLNKIENIPESSFALCENLKYLENFDKVVAIGKSAFSGCKSLSKVQFPETLTSISSYAFNATGLTSLAMSPNVTYGEGVFSSCLGLRKIALNGKKYVPPYTFSNCEQLSLVTGSENLRLIGQYAFSGCLSLKSFYFNTNLVHIFEGAFSNSGFESLAVTSNLLLEKSSFANCMKLKKVDLESSTEISEKLFFNCIDLEIVKNSINIVSVHTGAFYNCESLKKIHFKTIEFCDKYAFSKHLEAIFVHKVSDIVYGDFAIVNTTKVFVADNYTEETFAGIPVYKIGCTENQFIDIGNENCVDCTQDFTSYDGVNDKCYTTQCDNGMYLEQGECVYCKQQYEIPCINEECVVCTQMSDYVEKLMIISLLMIIVIGL
ncbi:hypothetical protein EIN_330680 [Entamoeba invadens IP1]|uniref:Leucine rich repeat containing protein BspA family protein n=1 Tax=Entamoeba invadens IP1 TaxID=370355 RepID=L7FLL6_ENTIV|nr:hypothetical protein EIN_330680 [Entamoeba invadens IP1]ELP88764.1 hypothetical protein EIN_330680 [Entamoeba invadens IP1]|eukprot:XP_004255535.1 hypothetical protein EIN_330680 [Entamoeba invadens IP1]